MGEEAVALARATGDDFALAMALNNVGGVMRMLGENERAAAYFQESLELRRRMGDASRIALSLSNVAQMALEEGKTNEAAAMFAEAAEIATAIGDKRHILFALAGLGWVAYREERWEEAGTHARESLRLAQELGMKRPAVEEIFCLAGIAAATGDTTRAVRLAAAAAFHLSRLAPDEPDNPDYQEIIESVKASLRPGNLGASLGGGPGNESRRGRRLRTLLRLTASAEAEGGARVGQCPGMSPDAAWAETDELRVAERSNPQIKSYMRPEEAAEKGVKADAQPRRYPSAPDERNVLLR